MPSPRNGQYGNGPNGRHNMQNGNNSRPRSLIMQKVDNDSSSVNPSRRNSEAPPLSRRNSTISQYENRLEQEQNKLGKTAQDGSDKLAQAKANLADDLSYVQAGARRASKYDLYWVVDVIGVWMILNLNNKMSTILNNQ